VRGYATADVRFGWRFADQFEFSLVGQNLFQPHHAESGGDPGTLVGIKRSAYAKITWQRWKR
jgi:iron complex outermembrane receptor protein